MTTGSQADQQETMDEQELAAIGVDTAGQVGTFLVAIREVAFGQAPQAALPLTLLAVAQVQLAGAKLGAMVDVVPAERFEPDDGPDPDLDVLREKLQSLFTGVDDYTEVADPILADEVVQGSLANDLAAITADLAHGLRHWEAGSQTEALWWWQFSYLSNWGERCAAALRVLLTLLAHVRLDVDEETAKQAELAALTAEPTS